MGNTAIFAVWATLTDLLEGAQWSGSLEVPGGPVTWLGDPMVAPVGVADSSERVVVVPTSGDVVQSVANISDRPGRDEEFTVPVVVVVVSPSWGPREVACRLEALTGEALEVVRAGARTVDRPAGLVAAGVWFWEVSQVRAALVPSDGGWLGQSEITVTVKARL